MPVIPGATLAPCTSALIMSSYSAKKVDQCPFPVIEDPPDVHHPAHYTQGGIETWDYIIEQGFGVDYLAGNILKYISRFKHKGEPVKDLKKARAYLDKLIKLMEGEDE